MEEFDSDNHERPIETYPGFIGMTMDYDFFPERQLRCLSNINWNRYTALREWVLDDHTITNLRTSSKPKSATGCLNSGATEKSSLNQLVRTGS